MNETHKLAISNGMKRFFDGGGKPSMRGRKHSEETKLKMSKAHKGVVISDWHKERLRELKTGKPLSESHVASLCIAQKKRFNEGDIIWSKGKKFNDIHRKNLSISHEGKRSRKRIFNGSHSYYVNIHFWIKKNLPKLECEHCESLNGLQYANKSGLYLKEVSDWIILCRSCHVKYDQSFTEEEIINGRK